MKNAANKFPLPTGIVWGRLPERVIALEAKNAVSTLYKALLTQSGAVAPVALLLKNSTGATITFGYGGTAGTYTITSSIPAFSTTKTTVDVGIGANKVLLTAVVNSTTQITITTSDTSSNALSNGLLTNNSLTIENFN